MDEQASLGAWIGRRRKALDLTQAELAQRVGCALGTLRKLETDERRPSKQIAARLADQLQLSPEVCATFLLVARGGLGWDQLPVPTQVGPLSPLAALPPRGSVSELPAALTPLIGREREVAALVALLRRPDVRLVTLTGPGGVGKTRLGLEVAAALRDAFADGTVFVNLAPVGDTQLVAPTIAQTLGVRELRGRSVADALQAHLCDKQTLLLLDNCEQVLDAVPELAALLATAPGVKVLATSRAALKLRGEKEVLVVPLALPPQPQAVNVTLSDTAGIAPATGAAARAGALRPPQPLMEYAAVALFVERARDVQPDFAVTEVTAPLVAEICTRLDGLPLAIELAAARSKLFPPTALLQRLEHRLPLLIGGPRDLPARQQTLRNTIDWSYQLLTTNEQTLVRRLAVFVGGCSLAAAEAVCRAADGPPLDVVDGVAALVDQSLLRQAAAPDGEPRLYMLELVREYALERLEQSGEAETLRQQHACFFLAFAEAAEPHAPDWPGRVWLERLEAEHANLRAALAWATAGGHAEVAARLAAALVWFWEELGYLSEARQWLETALGMSDALPVAVRARAIRGIANLAGLRGEPERAHALLEESLALWRRLGDQEQIAWTLFLLGRSLYLRDPAQATTLLEDSLRMFQDQANHHGEAQTLNRLGAIAFDHNNHLLAAKRLEASLALARKIGDTETIADALHNLSVNALLQGNGAQALPLEQASMALYEDNKSTLPWGFKNLGYIALQHGDAAQARTAFMASLALFRELESHRGLMYGLVGMAGVAALQHQWERAARLLGAAEALSEGLDNPYGGGSRRPFEAYTADTHAHLGEADFAAAWAAGQAMTLEQAVADALAVDPMAAEPARRPSTVGATDRASLTDVTAGAAGRASLTPREREVLRIVAEGATDQEAATRLGLRPRTVTTYLTRIYAKLDVRTRTAAVRVAREQHVM